MPAIKPISREYRIYLALWRKAFKNPEQVIIRCSSLAMAVAMRQGLYRAIRPFRYSHIQDDELREAADKFVVYLVRPDGWTKENQKKDQPHFLELRPRATLHELDEMFDDLGIDEEDLLLTDEKVIQASIKKLAKEMPKQVKTPYYTREE